MLATEVAKGEEANRFLLSHKTTTLSVSESPLSLGLTTADIIGETCTLIGPCRPWTMSLYISVVMILWYYSARDLKKFIQLEHDDFMSNSFVWLHCLHCVACVPVSANVFVGEQFYGGQLAHEYNEQFTPRTFYGAHCSHTCTTVYFRIHCLCFFLTLNTV